MKLIFLSLSFLVLRVTIAAQWYGHPPADLGYEPPVGWTYIMQAESTLISYGSLINNFHASSDSIYFDNRKFRFSPDTDYTEKFSVDAGKNWILTPRPMYPQIGSDPSSFIPGTFVKYLRSYRSADSVFVLSYSFDFGKTFTEEYPFDRQLMDWLDNNEISVRGLEFIPSDPQRIYMYCQTHENGSIYSDYWVVSYNKGKTWRIIELPSAFGPGGNSRKIVFDIYNPDTWYLIVQPTRNNDGTWTFVYRTDDDGKSFRIIPFIFSDPNQGGYFHIQSGFRGKGIIRRGLIEEYRSAYYVIGVEDVTENGIVIHRSNWARDMLGGKASNPGGGYRYWIDNILNLNQKSNSGRFVVTIGQVWRDTVTQQIAKVKISLFNTNDDGESWTPISWNDSLVADNINYDASTNSLWASSILYDLSTLGVRKSVNLWKLNSAISAIELDKIEVMTDSARIMPQPASEHFYMKINSAKSLQSEISILDVSGNVVSKNVLGYNTAGY